MFYMFKINSFAFSKVSRTEPNQIFTINSFKSYTGNKMANKLAANQ